MKKQLWGLAASLLVVSTLSLQAGEKLYRIRLASTDENAMGQPVSFQELAPTPAPEGGPPSLQAPPPAELQPVPDPGAVPAPAPDAGKLSHQTVQLYDRVEIEDLDNVHPCAVKKIVAVKDPCERPAAICGDCAPPCVYVMICVPPCDEFEYKVKRKDGSKVKYDYGKYEVEITSKDGVVSIDYDDSKITQFLPF